MNKSLWLLVIGLKIDENDRINQGSLFQLDSWSRREQRWSRELTSLFPTINGHAERIHWIEIGWIKKVACSPSTVAMIWSWPRLIAFIIQSIFHFGFAACNPVAFMWSIDLPVFCGSTASILIGKNIGASAEADRLWHAYHLSLLRVKTIFYRPERKWSIADACNLNTLAPTWWTGSNQVR